MKTVYDVNKIGICFEDISKVRVTLDFQDSSGVWCELEMSDIDAKELKQQLDKMFK